jgi:hypothetical protein
MSGWERALMVAWAWLFASLLLNLWFPHPVKLWERGRWALIFDTCDCWVGGYYDREDRQLYLIAVPTLAMRFTRP